jgi:integrase
MDTGGGFREMGAAPFTDVDVPTVIQHYISYCIHVLHRCDRSWESRLTRIAQAWHDRPLRSITHRDIEAFLIERSNVGNSGTTIRHFYGVISAFMNWAVANDYLAVSPIRRDVMRLPKKNDPRSRRLQPGEEARIRMHADQFLNDCMTMALQTGLRAGTIRQIQFKHVRPNLGRHGALVLPASIMKARKPHLAALTAETREILDRRREALAHLPDVGEAFAFGDPRTGRGFTSTEATERRFRRACYYAGVRGLRFHDLRAEAASRLYEAGAPLPVVQRFLGHTTLAMTEAYLRPRVGSVDDTVRQLEALVTTGLENARSGGRKMRRMTLIDSEVGDISSVQSA